MSVLMQKPNDARARPSTLLDSDSAYNRLFHRSNDLSTYYIVAKIGRKIEQFLKELNVYSISEINDIRFYVLFSVFVILTNNVYPTNALSSKITENELEENTISVWTLVVYDIYKDHGGDDKAAKGSAMIAQLRDRLRNEIEINNG